jgi:hypothetical protein
MSFQTMLHSFLIKYLPSDNTERYNNPNHLATHERYDGLVSSAHGISDVVNMASRNYQ